MLYRIEGFHIESLEANTGYKGGGLIVTFYIMFLLERFERFSLN